MRSRFMRLCLHATVALFMCSACTGINTQQLAEDPVYSETEKITQMVTRLRIEFFQLEEAYARRNYSFYLDRMSEIMELVRDEVERAEYFQKSTRYYRSGLDFERWQNAEQAFVTSRRILCEMMATAAEINLYQGDKEYAIDLLQAVIKGFEPTDDIVKHIERSKILLHETDRNALYADTPKSQTKRNDSQKMN